MQGSGHEKRIELPEPWLLTSTRPLLVQMRRTGRTWAARVPGRTHRSPKLACRSARLESATESEGSGLRCRGRAGGTLRPYQAPRHLCQQSAGRSLQRQSGAASSWAAGRSKAAPAKHNEHRRPKAPHGLPVRSILTRARQAAGACRGARCGHPRACAICNARVVDPRRPRVNTDTVDCRTSYDMRVYSPA